MSGSVVARPVERRASTTLRTFRKGGRMTSHIAPSPTGPHLDYDTDPAHLRWSTLAWLVPAWAIVTGTLLFAAANRGFGGG